MLLRRALRVRNNISAADSDATLQARRRAGPQGLQRSQPLVVQTLNLIAHVRFAEGLEVFLWQTCEEGFARAEYATRGRPVSQYMWSTLALTTENCHGMWILERAEVGCDFCHHEVCCRSSASIGMSC